MSGRGCNWRSFARPWPVSVSRLTVSCSDRQSLQSAWRKLIFRVLRPCARSSPTSAHATLRVSKRSWLRPESTPTSWPPTPPRSQSEWRSSLNVYRVASPGSGPCAARLTTCTRPCAQPSEAVGPPSAALRCRVCRQCPSSMSILDRLRCQPFRNSSSPWPTSLKSSMMWPAVLLLLSFTSQWPALWSRASSHVLEHRGASTAATLTKAIVLPTAVPPPGVRIPPPKTCETDKTGEPVAPLQAVQAAVKVSRGGQA
mmetsp:Transcript_90420/g.229919  ORF Transcript_90420/g.229919 Transcript_90420/m.229919 type:complete len:256 (-) Transcript_90420:277-1044(-)